MREVSLLSAVDAIQSSKQATRRNGLEDLENILKQNRNNTRVQSLTDNDFHHVLETLLEKASDEKKGLTKAKASQSAKSKPSAQKNTTASRLAAYSYAIRITVEIGVANLRYKTTIRALITHIIDEIRTEAGQFHEELIEDYFKALLAVLGHRPHLEHLSEDRWTDLIDLCCEVLKYVHDDTSSYHDGDASLLRSAARSRQVSRVETLALSSQVSFSSKSQSERLIPEYQRKTDDIASCIERLMSVHHIDVLIKADVVLNIVSAILISTVAVNRIGTQQPCLAALNIILSEAMTEDVPLAIRTLTDSVYFIRRHWGSHKSAHALKDQMLVSLLRGQYLFPMLLEQHIEDNDTSDLDGLLDRLMTEYRGRLVKDMLSLNDVDLDLLTKQRGLFSLKGCSARSSEPAESCWAQLQVVATLFGRLRLYPSSEVNGHAGVPSKKRRKLESPLLSLVSVVSTAKHEEILASLHFLTFVLGSVQVPVDQLQYIVDKLFPLLSRDNADVSNWSLMALAMVSQQTGAREAITNETTWHQILQVAITRFSTHRVSRAACYLAKVILQAELVPFTEATDALETLLAAVDVSGPSFLDESSVGFWKSVLALYNSHRAASYDNVSKSVLRWFFATWKPSRSGLARVRLPGVRCVADILHVLVGEPSRGELRSGRRILHPLARACLSCEKDSGLLNYLLSKGHQTPDNIQINSEDSSINHDIRASAKSKRTALAAVSEYLISEIDSLISAYGEVSQPHQLSLTLIRSSLAVSIIALGLYDSVSLNDPVKSNALLDRATKLRDIAANTLTSPGLNPDRLGAMAHTIYSIFEDLQLLPSKSLRDTSALQLGVLRVARVFGAEFWRQLAHQPGTPTDIDEDPMTIDESQGSQISRAMHVQSTEDIAHDWLIACTDQRAYQSSIRADLCFAAELPDPSALPSDEDQVLPKQVVDYLTSLHPFEFLATRPFLDDVYRSKLHIKGADGLRLLEFLAEEFENYELERCEAAMGTCLDLMAYLVKQWAAQGSSDELSDYAGQLYGWFLRQVNRKTTTSHVSTAVASMLQKVIKTNPEYGRSDDLPSARTVLFQILASGSAKVKFDISKTVSAVFGLFILREHDSILDDIEASIPHDPECLAVTAVRLFLLSRLASSWSTLIRRCVYAIVEATGLSPEVTPYAHSCLQFLGRALGIADQHHLFRLFVSQILYTWLGSRSISSLPYSIFDYGTLGELVQDCKHEIAAQVVMHGKEDEVPVLIEHTGIPFSVLLTEAFGKCAAYCIARDTAVAPEDDRQAAGAAVRLRKHVGKEEYKTLISERFPDIVAIFFRILDREDQIAKGFQRHERHAAYEAFESMIQSGASQSTPTVSQQPSFSSTCLINELEYVCHRSPYSLDELWTPALYVYVFRGLLETIQSPLGPLHAAAVVRRIRILVSMGGVTGTSGYCLEMALGSLRPYLDNTHSAEDVMGLYRYLLTAGETYLKDQLPFLTGFVVSVLASLKAFMNRPQESTTQESVFQATLTKAQEFHTWVTRYALRLQSASKDPDLEPLRRMVQSGSKLRGRGTSEQETAEGELLFLLLKDRAVGEDLIDEPSRKQIIGILSRQFQYAKDRRNDILTEDTNLKLLAPVAWQYFDPVSASPSFNLWLLRALGRTYASTGFIETSFRSEISSRGEVVGILSTEDDLTLSSSTAIIRLLYRVVCNNSTSEAGIAERTIQSLLTKADTEGKLTLLASALPKQVLAAMTWLSYWSPPLNAPAYEPTRLQAALLPREPTSVRSWARDVCLALIDESSGGERFGGDLRAALIGVPTLAKELLPYILHLVLAEEAGKTEQARKIISNQMKELALQTSREFQPQIKHMINAIIYLRSQPLPREKTKMERTKWLELDYRLLAEAALQCKMYKTSLLFIEIALSADNKTRSSRRSSAAAQGDMPTESLLTIFQNIDEKDYYYGVRQPSSLSSMMERFEFEGASFESLAFRGMAFDAEARESGKAKSTTDVFIRNLNDMQLSGLSNAIASTAESSIRVSSETTFDAARKLEKWDIPVPEAEAGPAVNIYQAFQNIQSIATPQQVLSTVDLRLEAAFPLKLGATPDAVSSPIFWSSVAAMVDMENTLTATSADQVQQAWLNMESQSKWMESTGFESIDRLLSCRETLFSILSKSLNLQQISKSSPRELRKIQIQALLSSSAISRVHGNFQKSLSSATAIEQLLPECRHLGLNVEAAARLEASNVLWEQGQMAPSIQILQDISNNLDLHHQDIPVGKPDVLSKLASRISEARLEQSDHILKAYLEPALKELRGDFTGDAAGQVFHEFASFCDKQLQDPDSLEDFNRVQKMREGKSAEINELDDMIKQARPSKERDGLKNHRNKAKTWYDLDNAEFKRLKLSRDALLTQSLEMYLLSLKACDSYDRDAMRFSALWLQNFDDQIANSAVEKSLGEVSSSKFASLMNQWTARLLDEETQFQELLSDLVVRICGDHPYHAMYNIFVSCKSRGGKDAIALSRHAAANKIVERLKTHREYQTKWTRVHNACVNYQRFATEKKPAGEKWKQGDKGLLRKLGAGLKLEQDVVNMRVPPPTIKIALRKDGDYKEVPIIVRWSSEYSVASGLSAPKIVTAIASDGQRYKMLFKAGNDDLRQDAIMEQVFEQVSDLLQAHRETRQRKLGIRSYKVLPLTHSAGVIEFVSNTVPLLEYLTPAHTDHYPSDLKNNGARKIIQDAASAGLGNDHRVKEYKRVCERFHPVLRFFFMERFETPDEWFEKRLAYTRTTAAISMLGHVLGLGDRHGHNILLDEKTGEVIHIDLGIAFEQGRVLPIPETVPFRLTRDIVDGMGVTKTEGVFRRCCEFTLDALRKESYGILTILDVLRFDPLYSWSISPVRLRRLQADKSQAEEEVTEQDGIAGQSRGERKDNEEAEADRALTVVNKKLSKSLSVEATVNQLIQQATDEKNLALLFAGWAAYF